MEQPRSAESFATEMLDAVRAFVSRTVAPILERMATAETRVAALSMLLAREPQDRTQLGSLEDLVARLDKAAALAESLERRASRHAEHLARLESRVKAMEQR